MKIQPTNRREIINSQLSILKQPKPAELSDDDWDQVQEWAKVTDNLSKLHSQIKDTAYRRFYQEYSFREIADLLRVDIGKVIFTALSDDWFSKVKMERRVRGGSSIEKTDKAQKELLHDIIDATFCVYQTQLRKAIENPEAAAECGLIPKNLKELQLLMSMVQSLQSKNVPQVSAPTSVTNINVQNLMNGGGSVTKTNDNIQKLSAGNEHSGLEDILIDDNEIQSNIDDPENDEDDDLSLLLRAKIGQ